MHKLLPIILVACTSDPKPPSVLWRNDRPIHAVTVSPMQSFQDRAETDLNRWHDALVARGCEPPFHYVNNGLEDPVDAISLVPNTYWKGTSVGTWADGVVLIRSEGDGTLDTYAYDPTWTVGLHELGHALGLEHSDYIEGNPSIMTTSPMYPVDPDNPLPERDIADAACLLGCGPC